MDNTHIVEDATMSLASGRQFVVRHGDSRAVITEVGAGLRSFSVGECEFLDTYGLNEMASSSRGQALIPWPNRIDHGRYTWNDLTEQLPLSELSRHTAIHGLTRWMNWQVVNQQIDRLDLGIVLYPQEGYPFTLSLQMTYALTIRGLECHTTACNSGTQPLPYGVGHHPYFTVGADVIDTDDLLIPARSYFPTNERLIPILPSQSVEGTPFDFRTMHAINDVFMDTGFTDLIPDEDNFTRVKLAARSGSPSVTVFMDATHQFLQVYTGDTLPTASERRRGIAIEPYTCATDAFNNGLGLLVLKPGETFTSVWGITASI